MADIGYFDAWDAWGRHRLTQDLFLWHVQLFWWGRIGKVLQLLGALTVVAELIGYTRLDAFSASLRAGHLRRLPGLVWKAMRRFWAGYWNLLTRRGEAPVSFILSTMTMLGTLVAVVAWGAGAAGGKSHSVENVIEVGQLVSLALGAGVVVGPVLIFIPLVLAASVAWVVDLGMLRPLAWTLRRGTARWLVQISGLLLLVIGIHFDLLAG
jgi:hypothetical protein